MKIDWNRVASTPTSDFTQDQWWVARHEAAHFLVAAHYDIPVGSVWLKTKKSGRHYMEKGAAGAVQTYDISSSADIVCTLAGLGADMRIKGPEWCLTDPGFAHEFEDAWTDTQGAMRDPWYRDLFVSHGYEAPDQEVYDTMVPLAMKARELLNEHWETVELVAVAFLLYAPESTGTIHHTRVAKLYEMTKFLLGGGDFTMWVRTQAR